VRELSDGGVHLVADPVGGAYAEPALRALRPFGQYLIVGFAAARFHGGFDGPDAIDRIVALGARSFPRELRDQIGDQLGRHRGELRAVGDVQRDQLYYLSRVGFDAFLLREGEDGDAALAALRDFSEAYQASVERPEPLFRRR